jgi:hypothetical protein
MEVRPAEGDLQEVVHVGQEDACRTSSTRTTGGATSFIITRRRVVLTAQTVGADW